MNNMLRKLDNCPKGLESASEVLYQERYLWQIFYLPLIMIHSIVVFKDIRYNFQCKGGYSLRNYSEQGIYFYFLTFNLIARYMQQWDREYINEIHIKPFL